MFLRTRWALTWQMLEVTNQGQPFVHMARLPPGGYNWQVPRSIVKFVNVSANRMHFLLLVQVWPQAVGKTRGQEDQVAVLPRTCSPMDEAGWPLEQDREHVCLSPKDHSQCPPCAPAPCSILQIAHGFQAHEILWGSHSHFPQ